MKTSVNATISSAKVNWRRKISCCKFIFLEFLATRIGFFNRLLIKWRKPVYLNEIRMAKISAENKVLFIGSGIIPYEAILIAEETKAKVVGIDNSMKTLKFAQSYIDKKGLTDMIKIEHGDGLNYSIQDFDVIFIAINVWPIDSILKHIYYHMKDDAKVMCKSFKNDIADVLKLESLHGKFSVKWVLKNPQSKSFLLIKNRT